MKQCQGIMEQLHWQNKTTCDQNRKMFGFVVCQTTPPPSPQNACLLIMGLISSFKKQLKMIEVKNQPSKDGMNMYVLITF